jgi:hypothetical protein
MIDELLEKLEASIERVDQKVYGVVTGTVMVPSEPLMLGRVQVHVPVLDDLVAFARVAVPAAGMMSGSYFIPNPGDDVLLAFENGDVNVPYVVGCLWNMVSRPPLPDPMPQVRGIRTPLGSQLAFSDLAQTVVLQNGPTPPVMPAPPSPVGVPYSSLVLGPVGVGVQLVSAVGITLQVGGNSIQITPAGITITSVGPLVVHGLPVEIG